MTAFPPAVFPVSGTGLRAALCSSILACCSPGVFAQGYGSGMLEAVGNDNVSRSPLSQQESRDHSLRAATSAGYHTQLADYTGLTLDGSLSHEQYRRYSGLSNTRAALSGTLSHKFGLGDRAPAVSLGATVERASFKLSLRNSWLYAVRLGFSRRISDNLLLRLAVTQEIQRGDYDKPRPPPAPRMPGDVWNLDAVITGAELEWDTGPASWLTAGMQYRSGDTVASVQPAPRFLAQSTAVTVDPAFGAGVVAYRLHADTRLFSLDWNLAISDRTTAYAGVERQLSRGGTDLAYQAGIIRLGLVISY